MTEATISTGKTFDRASASTVRKYGVGGRDYIVKSIFVGDADVKATLLKLAEKKAFREMGFDSIIL